MLRPGMLLRHDRLRDGRRLECWLLVPFRKKPPLTSSRAPHPLLTAPRSLLASPLGGRIMCDWLTVAGTAFQPAFASLGEPFVFPMDPGPISKRRRPAIACTECRRRKTKCDRGMPSERCWSQLLPASLT
jgi:hypothetical protein